MIKVKINNHIFIQKYANIILESHTYHDKFTKKKESIYIYKQENKSDIVQDTRAFMANLIHSIDANIALELIKRCADNNIPILTVHNCFYSLPCYLEEIKGFYREAYITIVMRSHLIEATFKANNINMEETFPKLYKILEKAKLKKEDLIKRCTNENILY